MKKKKKGGREGSGIGGEKNQSLYLLTAETYANCLPEILQLMSQDFHVFSKTKNLQNNIKFEPFLNSQLFSLCEI